MTNRPLTATIFFLTLAWSAGAQAQVWSDDKSAIADFYGTGGVTAKPGVPATAPSISIAVSINGTTVFSKGYGHVAPGQPVATGDTVYHIGSLSKQLLAASILALIEDTSVPVGAGGTSPAGAPIALDDPITKFIPDWGMTSTGPVTLRHMLNMHSGYADYTSPPASGPADPFDPTQPRKPREILRYVLSMLYSNKSPGGAVSTYAYSNTNYLLLANVIEFFKMKSMPGAPQYNYQTWLRSRIFAKAGMSNTGFLGDTFPNTLVAPPPYDLSTSSFAQPSWPMGAGEVVSTVNDLMKWHAALMSGTLVSTQARNTLLTPVGAGNYAMGWFVSPSNGFKWYAHNGIIPGYQSYDGIFLNTATGAWVSVAVLINSDNGQSLPLLAICLAQLAMDPSKTKAGLSPFAKAACGVKA